MTDRTTYMNLAQSLGTKLENMHQARQIWDYKITLEIDSEIPGDGAGFFCLVITNYGKNLVLIFGINNKFTPGKLEDFNQKLDQIIEENQKQFNTLQHGSL